MQKPTSPGSDTYDMSIIKKELTNSNRSPSKSKNKASGIIKRIKFLLILLNNKDSTPNCRKKWDTLSVPSTRFEEMLKDFKLEFPQIIVVGDEESGKSTLLERIAMFEFFPETTRKRKNDMY